MRQPQTQRTTHALSSALPRSRLGTALVATSQVVSCCLLVGCWESKRLDFGTVIVTDSPPRPSPTPGMSTNPGASTTAAQPTSTGLTSDELAPTTSAAATDETVTPLRPVRGKVVDFWGHPVPNVALDVGGILSATASDGTFQVDDVPAVYDISLVVHIDGEAVETYGWTYQGLTYRDVVLPVFRGLPPRRATLRLDLPTSSDGTLPCGAMALGGKHSHDAFTIYQTSTPISLVWRSVDVLPLNVQSLFWRASDADCKVPVEFLSWRQDDTTLYPGDSVTLALAGPSDGNALGTSSIEAVVRSADEGTLTTSLFLRFENGASVPVSSLATASGGVTSFAVPVIDATTLIVAGTRTGDAVTNYAVDYASFAAGSPLEVELRPPTSPSLAQPADEGRLSQGSRLFQWEPDDRVAILAVTRQEGFSEQFVVTSNNRVELPDLSHLGLVLEPDAAFSWTVEFHGAAPTVEEWLQAEVPLDPFSVDFHSPMGRAVSSGSLARSEARTVYFDAQ